MDRGRQRKKVALAKGYHLLLCLVVIGMNVFNGIGFVFAWEDFNVQVGMYEVFPTWGKSKYRYFVTIIIILCLEQ